MTKIEQKAVANALRGYGAALQARNVRQAEYEQECVERGYCAIHNVYFLECGCDDKEKAAAANEKRIF